MSPRQTRTSEWTQRSSCYLYWQPCGCITCKGKIYPINDKIGVCSRCSMTQRLDKCAQQLSAKLLVAAGEQSRTFVAFIPIIRRITKDETLTDLTSTEEITTAVRPIYNDLYIKSCHQLKLTRWSSLQTDGHMLIHLPSCVLTFTYHHYNLTFTLFVLATICLHTF